ncbi:hypothetical protein LEP3755_64870 (plasmid) [Leptolyngbya sp. NIES-3755]|nr:hypothetical protein LEP3755_64870 [Leptolyngbya sp. NIES-3755]
MSTKKFDYRVRIQVAAESPDGILLDCIKNERHQSYSHKEMLLWALRAYWMPIAYQLRREQGEVTLSDAQMKRIAQDAVHQLRQQIAYLQSTFDIDQNSAPEGSVGAMAAHPSQQLLSLLAANRTMGAGNLDQTIAIPTASTADSSSSKAEVTSTDKASDQQQKEQWYDGEDLFDSEI